ncbi:MAG: DUF5915 domain-containing protein [Bacteroidota bacterium]
MSVVSMGRLLRTENNLKVRQPLKGIHVVCRDEEKVAHLGELVDVIKDELNLQDVWLNQQQEELATLKAKPDFKKLGPRLGKNVKKAAPVIQGLSSEDLEAMVDGGEHTIEIEGEAVTLTVDDLVIERLPKEGLAVASEGELVVALETELDADLIRKGLSREFVNKVQNMRKEADLEVTQRIRIDFHGHEAVREAVEAERDYIMAETLADALEFVEDSPENGTEWDLNGHLCVIYIEKID